MPRSLDIETDVVSRSSLHPWRIVRCVISYRSSRGIFHASHGRRGTGFDGFFSLRFCGLIFIQNRCIFGFSCNAKMNLSGFCFFMTFFPHAVCCTLNAYFRGKKNFLFSCRLYINPCRQLYRVDLLLKIKITFSLPTFFAYKTINVTSDYIFFSTHLTLYIAS